MTIGSPANSSELLDELLLLLLQLFFVFSDFCFDDLTLITA